MSTIYVAAATNVSTDRAPVDIEALTRERRRITPVIARMKQLARMPGDQKVDLFHTTLHLAPEAREKLIADARATGVTLHIMVDDQDGVLTGEKLRAAVPEWQSASVWFCGPAASGQALRGQLAAKGLPRGAFHQELFNMR